MPKATFYYFPENVHVHDENGGRQIGWTSKGLREVGKIMRPLIAAACSTEKAPLHAGDVDWVPKPYGIGTVVDAPCALELETFAYPERVENLTEDVVRGLKAELVKAISAVATSEKIEHVEVSDAWHLVWLKYVDPRGHHV